MDLVALLFAWRIVERVLNRVSHINRQDGAHSYSSLLHAKSYPSKFFTDASLQAMTLCKEISEFICESRHLLLEGLSIFFLVGYAYIATCR